MVTHFEKVIERPTVRIITTLCGRSNNGSRDGMNATGKRSEVTCKLCRRLLAVRAMRETKR